MGALLCVSYDPAVRFVVCENLQLSISKDMVGRIKRNDVIDVLVSDRGRQKSLQQVLADGRSTGHFKLQGRSLQEARLSRMLQRLFESRNSLLLRTDGCKSRLDCKMMPVALTLT